MSRLWLAIEIRNNTLLLWDDLIKDRRYAPRHPNKNPNKNLIPHSKSIVNCQLSIMHNLMHFCGFLKIHRL